MYRGARKAPVKIMRCGKEQGRHVTSHTVLVPGPKIVKREACNRFSDRPLASSDKIWYLAAIRKCGEALTTIT